MACIIINGVEIDCADAIGGVAEIYLTEYTNVPQANITATSGVITAMTCSSGKKFWTFQLEKENGQFMSTPQRSVENGTLFYDFRDSYVVPEQGNKYLKFPRVNVFQ